MAMWSSAPVARSTAHRSPTPLPAMDQQRYFRGQHQHGDVQRRRRKPRGDRSKQFHQLDFTGAGITAATDTSLTVAGNLATSGAGTFTHTPGGSGTVTMSGSSKTLSGSGIALNNLTAAGSISSASSFGIAGNLDVGGSFSATAGTITMSGAAKVIRGAGSNRPQRAERLRLNFVHQ